MIWLIFYANKKSFAGRDGDRFGFFDTLIFFLPREKFQEICVSDFFDCEKAWFTSQGCFCFFELKADASIACFRLHQIESITYTELFTFVFRLSSQKERGFKNTDSEIAIPESNVYEFVPCLWTF